MRLLFSLFIILVFTSVCYAGECIVGEDGYVKTYTMGKYVEISLDPGDELREFDQISGQENERLKYEAGDIVGSGEFITPPNPEKDKLLNLLDDEDIKTKIKNIK